jgi:mRNA interferase YafQ
MRTIKPTRQYARDIKRVRAGVYSKQLHKLDEALELLATDQPLPARYRDHALSGKFDDYRDCHILPDLVLIYRKAGDSLELVRLGSHSELGL